MYTVNTLPSAGTGTVFVAGSVVSYHYGIFFVWMLTFAVIATIIGSVVLYRRVKGV